jgi:potassium-transporting ATPase potassium-binding subunit
MSAVAAAWLELGAFVVLLTLLTPVVGRYLAAVFGETMHPVVRALGPVEAAVYRVCRIDAGREMTWKGYLAAVAAFSLVSMFALFVLLVTQGWLPLNPQRFANVPPLLSLNVAVSFGTTTNWQAYSGESTLSYLSQMAGLAWQNFVAAGVGLAVTIAVIRGFTRSLAHTVGNFWVDLTRSWLYVLLPFSVIGAIVLMWQGTPQNFSPYASVTTIEGIHQTLVNGPMASQTIIEQLGANGGGFVAANVASPNLNPTAITDIVQFVAMFLLGAGLTNMFGRFVGNVRHGWLLYSVMLAMFVAGFGLVWNSEHGGNPLVHQLGISGPNMEGKEVRFGDVSSALSVAVATDTSSGAANLAYDSLMPVSVLTAMLNMQVGEIIFGGTGSGLYGMILLVMLTIFIAGLMIGRTPQYLGKKIGRREITLVVIATLVPPLAILIPAAIALAPGLSATGNPGPRALSEVLYAFTSVQANNGSVLGGLTIQTNFYNTLTALVMLVGRFGTLVVVLAIAGGLALQPRNDRPIGSLSASTPFFGALLIATALIVTALTFLPGDALGPIAEALVLHRHGAF